jgi:hypothetical protein
MDPHLRLQTESWLCQSIMTPAACSGENELHTGGSGGGNSLLGKQDTA